MSLFAAAVQHDLKEAKKAHTEAEPSLPKHHKWYEWYAWWLLNFSVGYDVFTEQELAGLLLKASELYTGDDWEHKYSLYIMDALQHV